MSELGVSKGSTLAVIPARGGSKRIPSKNIRKLMGKPIIAYTIRAAVDSGIFDQVVVSTDSKEIAAVALEWGAAVPFLRGAELADDWTPVSAVTLDALGRLDPDGTRYFRVAQMMANCPLRTAEDISSSLSQFIGTHAESQLSVTRYGWQNPWWAMRHEEGFEIKPLF